MKNIHILQTEKSSRLCKDENNRIWLSINFDYGINDNNKQNIYITSDEEIKEGDWCFYVNSIYKVLKISSNNRPIIKMSDGTFEISYYRKIILTTDQDLIKDGVQAIDDEFLEWFVKNPNCEEVEVEDYGNLYNFRYLILIPKEEHKQETLEEVANEYAKNRYSPEQGFPEEDYYISFLSFRAGAKWQQDNSNINALNFELECLKKLIEIVKTKETC